MIKIKTTKICIIILIVIMIFTVSKIIYGKGVHDGSMLAKTELKHKLIAGECIEYKNFTCSENSVYLFCDRYEVDVNDNRK